MTNNYVPNTNGKGRKTVPMKEIRDAFIKVGWIGKRRQTHLKLVRHDGR